MNQVNKNSNTYYVTDQIIIIKAYFQITINKPLYGYI